MGSIGQYAGEKSIIQDVVIENIWMLNGQFGARLKSWAGPDVGYGYIDNITFRNFWNANSQYAAYLDSCYFNVSSCQTSASCFYPFAHRASLLTHFTFSFSPASRSTQPNAPITPRR